MAQLFALPEYGMTGSDSKWVRLVLITIALAFLFVMLVAPMAAVFIEAFSKGMAVYWRNITDPATLSAMRLTLAAAAISAPLNGLFGLAAAWAVTRFDFPGRSLLVTLIDLPFAVSPVIAGLVFVAAFGSQTVVGSWLAGHGLRIIFATPGIVLATLFVTFPFVARELIPLMQEQGTDDEQAAITLGASGWLVFWRVTMPRIRLALVYGLILANARAIGEFGAVSVVSGHVRGVTNTLPLHVEILYNEYNFTGAFAVASLLAIFALATIAAKNILEWRLRRARTEGEAS